MGRIAVAAPGALPAHRVRRRYAKALHGLRSAVKRDWVACLAERTDVIPDQHHGSPCN